MTLALCASNKNKQSGASEAPNCSVQYHVEVLSQNEGWRNELK